MTSTITIGTNTITVVQFPPFVNAKTFELTFNDTVGQISYPFTGQTQTQSFPGADFWNGTVTYPPLTQEQADAILSAVMECRGIQNGFMMGDPMKSKPSGTVTSASNPIVLTTNIAASTSVATSGWQPNHSRLLLSGDYVQIGYRLHRVLDTVNSDASGNATLSVYPSLREAPTPISHATTVPLIINNPQGLFRRATNKATWSSDTTRLTAFSFQVKEYR